MTSRNGDSQLLLPQDETNVHLDSMSGNDVFRFHDLQQWYATSVWDVKRDFLRDMLDVCGDPLVLYSLQKIFDRAYTAARDVAQYCNIGDRSFDVRPVLQDNHESSLDVTALKTTSDDYTDWLGELSKHGQLAVFIRLMVLGGIDIIATTCDHIDHLIRLNGNLPNLRNSIGKNTEMQYANILTIPDDLLQLKRDELTDSEKILSETNLDENSSKIPDAVYRDYAERKNEWKNKLDAFEQKYHANLRTAEPDSDLAQMLPVSNVILAAGKLLSDTGRDTNATPATSANGNAEHIPLSLSHTLASVTEYQKARNYIDLQIDRLRLKIQETRQIDNKTEKDDCENVEPFNDYFCTENADSTHTLKAESSELSNNKLQTIDEFSTEII